MSAVPHVCPPTEICVVKSRYLAEKLKYRAMRQIRMCNISTIGLMVFRLLFCEVVKACTSSARRARPKIRSEPGKSTSYRYSS